MKVLQSRPVGLWCIDFQQGTNVGEIESGQHYLEETSSIP